MKTTSILILLLMAFFINSNGQNKMHNEYNETLKTIFERKSVRNFIPGKQISKDTLELIIRAGMSAPTGRNIQPWEFVVIDNPETMKELAKSLPYAKMLSEASAAIVVCGYPADSENERKSQNWMLDCAAASQNILLAVESLGLGAVWTAGWAYPERIESIRKAIDLPDDLLPLNVIPIGYPAGNNIPKDKFKSDRIHWNKFNLTK